MAAPETMISIANFERIVQVSVGELLVTYGFQLGDGSPYRIRYDRDALFVDIEYEASRSQELTIWLGDPGRNNEPPLALPDALRATPCDVDAIERMARSQTEDVAFLERFLRDARDLMSVFGQAFLRGDESAYAEARSIRSERARAYTTELRNRGVLEAADAAWRAKEYDRVHDLLNPIRDSLAESHLRRLRFAEKKLG